MKPVDQTTFGVPGGNCFSACAASLLHLPIEEVPYFMTDEWPTNLRQWLAARGLYFLYFVIKEVGDWRPEGFYILGGQSARGSHAVVARGEEVVHDPHPSRAGLLSVEDGTLILPFSPAGHGAS